MICGAKIVNFAFRSVAEEGKKVPMIDFFGRFGNSETVQDLYLCLFREQQDAPEQNLLSK